MNSPLSNGWAGVVRGRPAVGAAAERSRVTSMADVVAFTEMTGDRNPLHYDRELAEASMIGKLCVQGGVTSGLLNAIVAEDLPGPGSVFLSVEWRFVKAVGIGEPITGRVEVTEVRADKPICKLATSVRDGAGDLCLTGTATVYTLPLRPVPPGSERSEPRGRARDHDSGAVSSRSDESSRSGHAPGRR